MPLRGQAHQPSLVSEALSLAPTPTSPPPNKQAALSPGQGCGWGLGAGAASPQPQRPPWGLYPLAPSPAPTQRPPHCSWAGVRSLCAFCPVGFLGKDQGCWGWFLCGIPRPSGLRHKPGSEGAGRQPRACPGVAVLVPVPCEHPFHCWGSRNLPRLEALPCGLSSFPAAAHAQPTNPRL